MALHPNGAIPLSALDPVPAANGQTARLLPIPAASFLAVAAECRRAHGWAPVVTSAGDGFRSLARQVQVFLERYRTTPATVMQGGRRITDRRVWNGVPYWRHTGAAAAVPGTSNHGMGITVDVAFLRYGTPAWDQLAPILTRHGWSNAEGARINEPWHWNYTRTAYPVTDTNRIPGVDIPTPTGPPLVPIEPEEDVVASIEELRALIRAEVPAAVWEHRIAGGETAGGDLGSIRSEIKSVPGAVLATPVGTGGTLSEWVESIRLDLLRADAVTRAQLAAITTAMDALATSRGLDPDAIRDDVRDALSRLSLTVTTNP